MSKKRKPRVKKILKDGFRPYMGTVRPVRKPDVPSIFGPEPGSGVTMEPGPGKGFLEHDGCIAKTLVDGSTIRLRTSYTCFGCKKEVFFNNIIERPTSDKFEIFGDESAFENNVLYGLLLLNEADVESAERSIVSILEDAAGPSARFHCREIFNENSRAKGDWAKFSVNDCWEVASSVIKQIKHHRPAFYVGVGHLESWPEYLDGSQDEIKTTKEHIYPNAFAAGIALLLESKLPPENLSLKVALQNNKVEWPGVGAKQIQGLLNVSPLKGQPVNPSTSILFDVIDIALYSMGRELVKRSNNWSESIYKSIDWNISHAYWEPTAEGRPFVLEKHEGIWIKPKPQR